MGFLLSGLESIGLLTLCSFLIGVTIIVLFLGETTDFQMLRISIGSFLAGVVCFLLALGCFMAETLIATRVLNFGDLAASQWMGVGGVRVDLG